MRLPLVVAVFLLCACPPSTPNGGCNQDNCAGCCEASGKCALGQTDATCGAAGNTCATCGAGLSCQSGTCTAGSGAGGGTGGSGGSGSGGGAATGGGTGTGGGSSSIDQELVSGTRLRAVNFVGADGSRAPFTFYDTQLQAYCDPVYLLNPARCLPSVNSFRFVGSSLLWADAQCSALPAYRVVGNGNLDFTGVAQDAGVGAGTRFAVLPDGGFVRLAPTTAAYLQQDTDGGCVVAPPGIYLQEGPPEPLSSFMAMPLTRE